MQKNEAQLRLKRENIKKKRLAAAEFRQKELLRKTAFREAARKNKKAESSSIVNASDGLKESITLISVSESNTSEKTVALISDSKVARRSNRLKNVLNVTKTLTENNVDEAISSVA